MAYDANLRVPFLYLLIYPAGLLLGLRPRPHLPCGAFFFIKLYSVLSGPTGPLTLRGMDQSYGVKYCFTLRGKAHLPLPKGWGYSKLKSTPSIHIRGPCAHARAKNTPARTLFGYPKGYPHINVCGRAPHTLN